MKEIARFKYTEDKTGNNQPSRAPDQIDRVLAEELVITISVFKWVLLATAVGILVGSSTAGFLTLLDLSIEKLHGFSWYYVFLPLAFMASTGLVLWLAPDAKGHGTEKVIEAVHEKSGFIKFAVVPVKLVSTIITIAFGGSAGKEGPCAQIGAGLSSSFASLLRFGNHDRKKLVICGISAGFASVFGTPIAGAIFGVEVLFAGSIVYEVLLPSFIAGVTAYQTSAHLGVSYFHQPLGFVPLFSEVFFAKVVLAGVFFGVCSVLLILGLRYGAKLASRSRLHPLAQAGLAGASLVLLAYFISDRFLGLGLETIQSTLSGIPAASFDFLAKILFTVVTLSFGGSGGIVTPIFFIGATSGSVFANLVGSDPATFSAIGMVCLLAGAANTPIAASILSVELFGPDIAPYATVACVISFLATGHRSVYPSQVLSVRKSPDIRIKVGRIMDEARPEIDLRASRSTRLLLRVLRFGSRLLVGVKKFRGTESKQED